MLIKLLSLPSDKPALKQGTLHKIHFWRNTLWENILWKIHFEKYNLEKKHFGKMVSLGQIIAGAVSSRSNLRHRHRTNRPKTIEPVNRVIPLKKNQY